MPTFGGQVDQSFAGGPGGMTAATAPPQQNQQQMQVLQQLMGAANSPAAAGITPEQQMQIMKMFNLVSLPAADKALLEETPFNFGR
jgi:hypothetical protein